jgi:hypothetical protein
MKEPLAMNDSTKRTEFLKKPDEMAARPNWLFEVESFSRSDGETLTDLRDRLRLKRALKQAVQRDFAPLELIRRIRTDIRA